jgi:hypothetical protein
MSEAISSPMTALQKNGRMGQVSLILETWYLEIADRHGVKPLFVIFDAVWHPNPHPGRWEMAHGDTPSITRSKFSSVEFQALTEYCCKNLLPGLVIVSAISRQNKA